ncbi:AI-2E family transporter [Sphaerisporangium corydalis]|uniref:AI-2E family transporter n=1 Tax=Sphaerisporangium corydalis TaxID=1441875 RepID=A0ABV9ET37_9ACTN|nr:AI-2E family transporter [Sphaerisporangium corydalis]
MTSPEGTTTPTQTPDPPSSSPHDPSPHDPSSHDPSPATGDRPFGKLGRPFDRRSPFFVGMTASAGVALTYGLILLLEASRDVLILIGLALFLAIGLDPAASWLVRRGLPRWAAVFIIVLLTLGMVGGFLALAIPVLVNQGTQFATDLPGYLREATSHNSVIGQLNERFGLEQNLKQLSTGERGISLVGGLLGAGKVVLGAAASTLIVLALTIYFLADMPRIKATVYRCVPQSRRGRVVLIGDDILGKVGMFVLGNLLTSLIAGVAAFVWLQVFHVPYALLLALFVALMDLVPVVGSTVAGLVVILMAWTVSLPIALATVGFVLVYRAIEDYLLVPRIMGKAVEVPGVVTLIAVTIGATLLGIIGALIAIPVAAALRLVLREVAFPRLDRS